MKDHQLGYTLPLQPLGAKIERHQATPEDRRAMELCKFEQKRHEVEPICIGIDVGSNCTSAITAYYWNPNEFSWASTWVTFK